MNNSVIKQEISISNVKKLHEVIENNLRICKDIQIFISVVLYNQLLKQKYGDLIWGEEVLDGTHYCDKEEKAFLMYSTNSEIPRTVQMNFVASSSSYMQLTFFATSDITYRHYLNGMEKILIINLAS